MIGFFGAWLGLVILAMPVAFALGVVALGFLVIEGAPVIGAPQRLMAGVDSFTLLAVPFFILAGNLMNTSGVTDRIYNFANAFVGHFRGGLGHVNVVGSVIFSGMSGSAVADAGGLGALEIKAMTKEGYPRDFAGALTAASCVVGPIIPPSIPLVLYAVIANVSVGRLFLGGILPGIVIGLCLMAWVWWVAGRAGFPRGRRHSWAERGRAAAHAFLPLLTPAIILGGMFAGIFTATEAAAVAALYALILGTVVYRELGWRDLLKVFRDSMNTTAVVGFIVAAATLFNWVLARERVPQQVAELLLGVTDDPLLMLLLINLLLLFLGMFMEALAIMVLTVPVLMPVIAALGIDPVHFGLVLTLNLMIGLLTPPMGIGLFVVAKVGGIPLQQLIRAVLPFFVPLVGALVLITVFPQITLFLPDLVFGKR
ncbi:TRAP transporter large permease [Falsiroseomonas sp. CW058]|uniref:TRAP transporter large permease n=1 Tax=Falsiroseomonas sp. CW058 TaxID=3388664 RepID=UPI003D312028